MLQGKSLSVVQSFANQVMLFLESKHDIETQIRQLKLTLVGQDPVDLAPELFPEFFSPKEIRDLETAPPDAEVEVVNTVSPEEVDEFLDLMGVSRR